MDLFTYSLYLLVCLSPNDFSHTWRCPIPNMCYIYIFLITNIYNIFQYVLPSKNIYFLLEYSEIYGQNYLIDMKHLGWQKPCLKNTCFF